MSQRQMNLLQTEKEMLTLTSLCHISRVRLRVWGQTPWQCLGASTEQRAALRVSQPEEGPRVTLQSRRHREAALNV